MLNIFYQIYFFKFKNSTLDNYYTRLIVRLANYVLAFYYSITHHVTKKRKISRPHTTGPQLIVSLTTFPDRIHNVWLVIETILDQTHKPDSIMLWLSADEFENYKSLPGNLRRLQKRGLQIHFCDDNLMPHKKYFYTMQKYPSADIITIDDDVLYPPDLVKKLMECHSSYPDAICCTLHRKIELCENGEKILPYNYWVYTEKNSKPTFDNQMIGVGGVLYPKNSLHEDVFDKKQLKELALLTDDLWLKIMSIRNNTKVAGISGEFPRFFIHLVLNKSSNLADDNIGNSKNDQNFYRLIEHFNIAPSIFKQHNQKNQHDAASHNK